MKPLRWTWPRSGPRVARLFHRLLALVFLDAFVSLGVQVQRLYGSRGLIPAAQYLAEAHSQGLHFWQFPTVFWFDASDGAITSGILAGIAFSLAALLSRGLFPRVFLGLATLTYLSFIGIGQTFLYFQWDNLLMECGAFSIFLPHDRKSPWAHTLFRLIAFKLYWESGVAKWESSIRDWQDGSAMVSYYQTAPLPTALAWFAHHAPVWWHHLESWMTLLFELGLPFLLFGPRPLRLFSALFLTFFQIVNAATANYGFFCYLATCLHVFLLDDDIARASHWIRAKLKRAETAPIVERALSGWRCRADIALATVVLSFFGFISLVDGLAEFTERGARLDALAPLRELWEPFRFVNTYHLFGSITWARVEPQFETFDGASWSERDLRYKMGAPRRRPAWVAPHQPRLDFQLWFYGLNYRAGAPPYIANLLERMCHDPDAVDGFFAQPLPRKPSAVRITFYDYAFSSWSELEQGIWWDRKQVNQTRAIPCDE